LPLVYPSYGDNGGAWTYTTRITTQIEFLVVQYPKAVNLIGMDIYETYNPSGLVRISALPMDVEELHMDEIKQMQKVGLTALPNLGPGWVTVYQTEPQVHSPQARINFAKFNATEPIKARIFRIDVDARSIQGWYGRSFGLVSPFCTYWASGMKSMQLFCEDGITSCRLRRNFLQKVGLVAV